MTESNASTEKLEQCVCTYITVLAFNSHMFNRYTIICTSTLQCFNAPLHCESFS